MGDQQAFCGSSSTLGATVPHDAPTDPSSFISVPSIPITMGYEYEVFLSFRGPDTRTTFTDYLYEDLLSAGIRAFKDDEDLRRGEEIGPELLRAIEQSKISIPIFSKGYAWSKWCLKEAVQMVECMETSKQIILPVFYDVTPHQVRHQTEDYGLAFCAHEKNHSPEIVTKWKDALSVIGKLKGWDLADPTNRYQGKLVKEIISEVWKQLDRSKLDSPDHLIGIDDHVDEIMDILDIEIPDVRIVGIWGMGGVGKTTLAKFVFNQLMDHFEHCCFLSNVREKSLQPSGMESLQRQLVSDILRYKHEEFANVDKGKGVLRYRIPHKKVLILLDDVDRTEQLSNLLPGLPGFVPGSRIIITTGNRIVLDEFQVERTYRVTEMNQGFALELFCQHAFGQNFPITEFSDLSWEIAKATGGLPLAIEVIGSYLSTKLHKDVWEEALDWLKKETRIQERLRISFDALNPDEREMFLDIACLFAGMDYRVLTHMWKACGFSPASAIQDLCLRSLIKIGNDKEVWMHDQLKKLGREIVRQENYYELGERSRLWCHKDAIEVLETEEGTSKVKVIHLDHGLEEVEKRFEGRKFDKLTKLLFLELGDANLDGNFEGRLFRLKWLSWHGHTILNIPSDLHPKNLAVLDLSNSSVTTDWIGWSSNQILKQVEVVNLASCHKLMGSPHFTLFQSIKKLILEDCQALVAVHPSIQHLTTLESLNLRNCRSLKRLPEELGSLSSLIELVIDGTLIQELPISAGMSSLKTLSAQWCRSLTQIPDIKEFLKLQQLLLNHCESLKEIPSSIGNWQLLEELNLSHTSVGLLPDSVENLSNLKVLDISHSSMRNFPHSLGKLRKLEVVNASCCRSLAGTIPFGVKCPTFLRILRLDHTSIARVPFSIEGLSQLQTLNLKSCIHLENLSVLPSSLVNLKVTCQSPETALLKLPNLVNLKQLEILGCASVTTIPENIGVLCRLKELLVGDCPSLQSLPQFPSGLRHLQLSDLPLVKRLPNLSILKKLSRFHLLNCSGVVEIPGLKDMVSLKTLKISSPLTNLNGIEYLSSLSYLSVEGCKFGRLPALSKLKGTPALTGLVSLEILDISGCGALVMLPELSQLQNLKQLKLRCCNRLRKIPTLTGLALLEILDISDCSAIEMLPDLSSLCKLKQLKIGSRKQMPELTRLASLEILYISECGMKGTLPDLSTLIELKQLKLYNCSKLQDVSELTGLVSLEILEISDNGAIKMLPQLSRLHELKQLRLHNCSLLEQIPMLAGMSSLEKLDISSCDRLLQLPSLSSLYNLEKLYIEKCNKLLAIRGLRDLVSLEVLHISDCIAMKELGDLRSLMKLRKLVLRDLQSHVEIPGLLQSTSLEVVHVINCREIAELLELSKVQKLKELRLAGCQQIHELGDLVYLEVLDLSSCKAVKKVLDLPKLHELRELRLTCCHNVVGVRELGELVHLEFLDLSFCEEIKGILDLSKLEKLRELKLIDCEHLVGIRGLAELVHLEVLDLSSCEWIKGILDLSKLKKLRKLKVDSCRDLVGIQGLAELVHLEALNLSSCEWIKGMLDLSKLQKLRELKLVRCRHLVGIQGLAELAHLEVLDLSFCGGIKGILDLSKLQKLRELKLVSCRHLVGIRGLGELNFLKVLDLSQCESMEIPDLQILLMVEELKLSKCHWQLLLGNTNVDPISF